MKNFQYQLLRFLPDRVSGEFINLGVVVYHLESKQLAVEVVDKTARLSQIFPNTNTRYILKLVKHISQHLSKISSQLSDEMEFEHFEDIEQITRRVLPKDDSSLFFTASKKILDVDINAVSSYLYDRLIGNNQTEVDKEFRSDREVWSN